MTVTPAVIRGVLDQVGTAFPAAAGSIAAVEDVLDNLMHAESATARVTNTFFNYSDGKVLVETTYISPPIELALPGFDAISVQLRRDDPLDDELEVQLALMYDPSGLRLALDDLPLSIVFKTQLLRQMIKTGDEWALADPPDFVLSLQGASIEIDGTGALSVTNVPTIVPGPVQIGSSGVIVDIESVQILSGNEATPPVGVDQGAKGVYISDADVYLPKLLQGLAPSDLHAEGLLIGTGGLSGKITSTWGASGSKPITIGGITCALESVELEFKQNSLTDSALKCTLTVPFFDQPLELDVSLSGDGDFLASLSTTQPPGVTNDGGLVHFGKPQIFDATLEGLSFAVSNGVAKLSLSGTVTPTAGGLRWPTLDIRELSIDSKGHVAFDGGWTPLASSHSFEFYGAKLELTKFGIGMTDDGGKFVALSGKVELVKGLPAGASVEGLRLTWYPSGSTKLSFNGIGVSFKTPALEFDGHVSYTQQGTAHEFRGDLKVVVPAANHLTLIGKAVFGVDIGGNKYFAIYVEGDFGTGIPLWATGLSLYGFAGLVAVNYAPDKPDEMLWYSVDKPKSWFHKQPVGVTDILGKWKATPGTFALGAGVTLGTTTDNGFAFNGKFLLLMLCSGPVLMLDGAAFFLSKRDDGGDPPFHGLIVLDNRAGYFLVGLDARWKYDKAQGLLADISGSMEAYFNYQDPAQWHLWLGKQPMEQRIQARIAGAFTAAGYFMLDAKQLALGAWIGKSGHYKVGPVKADLDAYLDANAAVNFKPAQFHADLHLHGHLAVKVLKFNLGFTLDATLSADVFKPFHIVGELDVQIETKIKNFDFHVRLEWGPRTEPPPLRAPELLPVVNWGIAHRKSPVEWPMSGPGALPAQPVVPADSSPYVVFNYPVRDAIGVGVNPIPDPGWTTIGDPARGEGSARVRYALAKMELYRDGQLVAACPVPQNAPALGKLFGAWAPPVPGTAGQSKLLVGSRNPLELTDKTDSWNPWLASHLPGYPCPDTSLKTTCMDFRNLALGTALYGAWWDPQKRDFRFDWSDAGPHRVVPVTPAVDGCDRGLSFPLLPARKIYRAYVSNYNGNNVTFVDLSARAVLASIAGGYHPRRVVLSPDKTRAYVCSQEDNEFNTIDTATNSLVHAPLVVVRGPDSIVITPDGKRAIVASSLDPALSVIDLQTLHVTTVALASVGGEIVLSSNAQKFYVTHVADSKLSVFSVSPVAQLKVLSGVTGATAMVVHPTVPRAWISSRISGTVRDFDTNADTLLTLETPTGNFARDLAISPDGLRLYVGNYLGNTISVLATHSLSVLATIPFPTPAGLRVTPDGALLVVSNYAANTVSTIDTATNQIVGQGFFAGFGSNSFAFPDPVTPAATTAAVTIDVPPGSSMVEVRWAGSGSLTATVSKPAAAAPAPVRGGDTKPLGGSGQLQGPGDFAARAPGALSAPLFFNVGQQPAVPLTKVVASAGAPLKIDASKFGPVIAAQGIDQITLVGDAAWTLVEVCVTKLQFAGGLAELQSHHSALDQNVTLWKNPLPVLEPGRNYELRVDWTAEVQGLGELSGWSDSFSSQSLGRQTVVPFQTALPPALGTVSQPYAPPKDPPTATGFDDLALYVRTTIPAAQTPAHTLPELTKPVFRGYDVGVEFNESYVDQLYRAVGRDLDLLLFDQNNLPVRDAAGALIIAEDAWANAPSIVLTQTQARWIELFNANTCKLQTIDPTAIAASKVLRAAGAHVLAPGAVYQARLVPQLAHQLTVAGPEWIAPSGSAWTDYRVSVLALLKTPDAFSVLLRYTPASYYQLIIDPGNNLRTLVLVQGGATTKLAQDSHRYFVGKDDPLRIHVEAVGPALLVVQNGVVVFAVNDATLASGSVGLRQATGQNVFSDLGVSDLSRGAPIAYAFPFTTSAFANAYHHVHSFADAAFARDVAALAPQPAAVASAANGELARATAAQPVADAELRAYDVLASQAIGPAAALPPARLDVTRLDSAGTTRGWLVRSPEPIDFTRTKLVLSAAARLLARAQTPGALKITEAALGDAESITLLARDTVDLSGYRVQYRRPPSALVDDLGSGLLATGGDSATTDPSWSDYRARVVCSTAKPGGIGLMVRYADAQNFYAFTYDFTTGMQQLVKTLDGTPTVIQSARGDRSAALPAAPKVKLEVSLQGAKIVAYRDGVRVLDATDSDLGSGGAAVYAAGNAAAHFEQFEVRRLPNERFALFADAFTTAVTTGWAATSDGSGLVFKGAGATSWTDVVIRARVQRNGTGTSGLAFRYQDAKNHYRFVFTDTQRSLERLVQGTRTVLWSAPTSLAVGRSNEIAISAIGSALRVFQDSVMACEISDAALASGSAAVCAVPGTSFMVSQLVVYPPELAYTGWIVDEGFDAIDPARWSFVDAGDQAGPSAWVVSSGRLIEKSGIADSSPDPLRARGTVALLAGVDSDQARLVTRILSPQPGRIGVVFGYRDADDFYRFSIDGSAKYARLVRVVAGNATLLWGGAMTTFNLSHDLVLTLDVAGDCVTVWLDGRRVCEWRMTESIVGAFGLYCSKNAGASFGGVRVGRPAWVEYYAFGAEPPLAAGNRVLLARAPNTPAPNRRTVVRVVAELDDAGYDRLPPDGTRLRLVAPDGSVQHARDVIPAADFGPFPFKALRKADGTGIFIAPAASAPLPPTLRLAFAYQRNDGIVALTEAGESGEELASIDVLT